VTPTRGGRRCGVRTEEVGDGEVEHEVGVDAAVGPVQSDDDDDERVADDRQQEDERVDADQRRRARVAVRVAALVERPLEVLHHLQLGRVHRQRLRRVVKSYVGRRRRHVDFRSDGVRLLHQSPDATRCIYDNAARALSERRRCRRHYGRQVRFVAELLRNAR